MLYTSCHLDPESSQMIWLWIKQKYIFENSTKSNFNFRETSDNSENEEDIEEYVIEKILDKRNVKYYHAKTKQEFLVKWKGYGDEHNSWEPKSNLSLEIIKEYEKEKKKKIPKKEPEQGNTYFKR